MANKADLKAILDEAGVKYKAKSSVAELEELVKSIDSGDDSGDQGDGADNSDQGKAQGEIDPKVGGVAKEQGVKEKGGIKDMRAKIMAGKMIDNFRLSYRKGDIKVEEVFINGVKFEVPRGKSVRVPEAVADLLENKIQAEEGDTENAVIGADAPTGVKLDGSEDQLN